ncbi:hypothetical protein UlMin_023770 [Ulmus minor]
MERVRTLTMNWDALKDDEDDDRFFDSYQRMSSVVPIDLDASSSDDEDDEFDDCRVSFASTVSSVRSKDFRALAAEPDYNIWMAAPSSIKERRRRLLQGMGLTDDNESPRLSSPTPVNKDSDENSNSQVEVKANGDESPTTKENSLSLPIMLVRSRSEGEIEAFSVDKQRKEELIGMISKQRLTRTYSIISAPQARLCPYISTVRVSPKEAAAGGGSFRHRSALSSILSNSRFGAFFLIKNLDTGKEFIVNEYNEDGMWNRLSDLQTGKQLTMEEFEESVGYSPVVKELMRRENVSRINGETSERKFGGNYFGSNYSYISRSLRMSKRRGVSLLKNSIRGVAHSMSGLICEKENSNNEAKPEKSSNKSNSSSEWVKVRQSGKSYKELSAVHLCQEIQAHEGSIWTIKFSSDARFLASAGEDRAVHVWEVQECEIMSLREDGGATPLHPSLCSTPDRAPCLADAPVMPSERRKKGKGASGRRSSLIPDYVHVPETLFALSEKPFCSFIGHLDDVLDLSWSRSQLLLSSSMDKTVRLWDLESKSCLKMFAHNDYVTCIQFNPVDDDYFISGSLDAKVRIWSIPDRQVVDWTDLHEMVTAACYTPDGQGALVGSHKGNCRMYSAEDCKLTQKSQIDFQYKKKSQAKKITGFQFSVTNPSEVVVTSADSRIRILDGPNLVHKFKGFRNTSSQIAASLSEDGKYVISASEDSQVYVWKRDESRVSGSGKRSLINTRSYEQFQCKDVSVAILWPGTIKGEPPTLPLHSKRHSKRSFSQPPSASGSPTREDNSALNSKKQLPPIPKKNPLEEELSKISRAESTFDESFNSDAGAALLRYGDSPSISATPTPSSSWSSSWSWFDYGGSHGSHTIQATAWGMVIVTAGLGGEIRAYQNFGLPRKVGRQTNLFGGPT